MNNTMALLALLALVQCSSGSPGGGPDDGKLLVLHGRAAMPAPVTGAEVVIFRAGEEGAEELTRTTLNESGAFTAEVPGVRDDDVLLVQVASFAEGEDLAAYEDTATGAAHLLKEGQALAAYLPVAAMEEGDTVTVDPWSTLAACLAEHYHRGDVAVTPDGAWSSVAPYAASLSANTCTKARRRRSRSPAPPTRPRGRWRGRPTRPTWA